MNPSLPDARERELFEALPEFRADPNLLARNVTGSYIFTRVAGMWSGWRARASAAPVERVAEPVAWMDAATGECVEAKRRATWPAHNAGRYTVPLYASPPPSPSAGGQSHG